VRSTSARPAAIPVIVGFMIFTYTAPGRLESPDGYAIVRNTLGWEIHFGASRLGRPWVATAAGYDTSLREARRHAEAHHRFTIANPERPATN
jgi:hypothetical protein